MLTNKRLVALGSLDGGDEVLMLLDDTDTEADALQIAHQTEACFSGPTYVHTIAEHEALHLEQLDPLRPYVSHLPGPSLIFQAITQDLTPALNALQLQPDLVEIVSTVAVQRDRRGRPSQLTLHIHLDLSYRI